MVERRDPIPSPYSDGDFIWFRGGDYVVGIGQKEQQQIFRRWPAFGSEWFARSPHRTVRLKPFGIGRNSVTSAEFARTLTMTSKAGEPVARHYSQDSAYATVRRQPDGSYAALPGDETLPVSGVTLEGARRHAAACHARLPGEDEWEVAARAQIAAIPGWTGLECAARFANGFDTAEPEILAHRRAFLDGRGPVEERWLPSGNGVPIGMIGNLWEWCESDNDSGGALRGGSWNEIVPLAFHPAFRHRVPCGYPLVMHFGLRLAASEEESR